MSLFWGEKQQNLRFVQVELIVEKCQRFPLDFRICVYVFVCMCVYALEAYPSCVILLNFSFIIVIFFSLSLPKCFGMYKCMYERENV